MEKQVEDIKQDSKFLGTDGGKTKSNAIEVPSISLPKSGGEIKSIDEKFSVNAVNGTASFSIPIPVSPERGDFPSLSLSYNCSACNGIFGLGWTLGLSSIKKPPVENFLNILLQYILIPLYFRKRKIRKLLNLKEIQRETILNMMTLVKQMKGVIMTYYLKC